MQTKIVVNGTFDILHPGHTRLLSTAKWMGDYLLVCIDSDRRVKELKGHTRPVFTQDERKEMLMALRWVDEVRIFNNDAELEQILAFYQPTIMVKGSDWKNQPIVGEQYCKRIHFYDRINAYSTTAALAALE